MSETAGRPTDYTDDLADKICSALSDGASLRKVCEPDDMPCKATIFNWLRTNKEFLDQYERAKQESADAMADEILDIADDGTNDWIEKTDKDGAVIGETLNSEHVQRSRLRIDTRKFLMAKMKPKKYGDKVDLNVGGQNGNPIVSEIRRTIVKGD